MKIPFDIKYKQDIIDGKKMVVTRDMNPVRILSWDVKSSFPIAFAMEVDKDNEVINCCQESGQVYLDGNSCHDLFILDEDPEPTEFEKCFIEEIEDVHGAVVPADIKAVKESCNKLLEIAKKGIMKDLPRWKKDPLPGFMVQINKGKTLYKEDFSIDIEELWNKLPKETDNESI